MWRDVVVVKTDGGSGRTDFMDIIINMNRTSLFVLPEDSLVLLQYFASWLLKLGRSDEIETLKSSVGNDPQPGHGFKFPSENKKNEEIEIYGGNTLGRGTWLDDIVIEMEISSTFHNN